LEDVDGRGGTSVGGLVGINVEGTITNSYYPGDDITCTGCDNTIGNTTKANLQNKTWLTTPPNDWDFVTIWGIEAGVTYPYLQWPFADINCTCGDICVSETRASSLRAIRRYSMRLITQPQEIPFALRTARTMRPWM